MWLWLAAAALVFAAVSVAFVLWRRRRLAPALPFAAASSSGADFTALEREHPLTVAHRLALTQENIDRFRQLEIDQIYARLAAGPLPDGPYRASFFFAAGGTVRRSSELLKQFAARLEPVLVDWKLDQVQRIGELLWSGKRFFRMQGLLRSMISLDQLGDGLCDVDPRAFQREAVQGVEFALLFPARLYRGRSLLDARRDSVIIDYADCADLGGYLAKVDRLVSRDALHVREEIRMIRPGFYLGRAYFGERFAANFTLYSEAIALRDGPAFVSSDGQIVEPPPPVRAPAAPPQRKL